jgi:hypothetical protein
VEQGVKVLGKALVLPVPGQAKRVLVPNEQAAAWHGKPGTEAMRVSLQQRK